MTIKPRIAVQPLILLDGGGGGGGGRFTYKWRFQRRRSRRHAQRRLFNLKLTLIHHFIRKANE